MKKTISIALLVVFMFTLSTPLFANVAFAAPDDPQLPALFDKSLQPRIIVTTDVECDDMNGLITMCMLPTTYDVIGIVRSAGEWRWDGDRDPNDYSINLGTTLDDFFQSPDTRKHYTASFASTVDRYYAGTSSTLPWRCRGTEPFSPTFVDPRGGQNNSGPPSVTAGSLVHYREAGDDWLMDLWDVRYREVYPNLVQHDPNYPDPDEMVSKIYRGNCAFEADVRYDSPGSILIENAMLDDDMRPLIITTMGGGNTVTRALISIREKYKGTPEWSAIVAKIRAKVQTSGGEDAGWTMYGISSDFSFTSYSNGGGSGGGISTYGSPRLSNPLAQDVDTGVGGAGLSGWSSRGTNFQNNKYHQGKWLSENLVLNHGPVAGHYYTHLDGQYIGADYDADAEPRTYQWGRTSIHDAKLPYARPLFHARYDWTGHQGTSTQVSFGGLGSQNTPEYDWGKWGVGWGGVRGTNAGSGPGSVTSHRGISTVNTNGNFLTGAATGTASEFGVVTWEELAARANWCVADSFYDANNAPFITVGANQQSSDHFVYGKPGDDVKLEAEVSDPDGDDVYVQWQVLPSGSAYSGTNSILTPKNPASPKTTFTIPADAVAGDYFNMMIIARDNDAEAPMTRVNQVIVHVVNDYPAGFEPAPAPVAATPTGAVVTMENSEIYATRDGVPVLLKANVTNTGERVYFYWKENRAASTYTGANKLVRPWYPSRYETEFTVPTNAAIGSYIIMELWGGVEGAETTKYGEVKINVVSEIPNFPVVKNVTMSPTKIIQGKSADIEVTVVGENLDDRVVTATILGETAVVKNGKAIVKLTADDVFEYGRFKVQVEVEGTYIKHDTENAKDITIQAYTEPEDMLSPTVTIDGDKTIITFSEENQEFAKTDEWERYPILAAAFTSAKKVTFGTTTIDNAKVTANGNVITIDAKADPGQAIEISGVTLLSNSYLVSSYDFSLRAPGVNLVSLNVAPETVVTGTDVSIPVNVSVENLSKVSVISGVLNITDSRFNVNVSTAYPGATVVYNAENGKFSLFKVGGFADAAQADVMTITLSLKTGQTLKNGDTLTTILDSIAFTYAFGTDEGTSPSFITKGTAITRFLIGSGVPGDLNGDGKVDAIDLAKALDVYGKRFGDTDWFSSGAYLADMNSDGVVNMGDIMVIAYISVL